MASLPLPSPAPTFHTDSPNDNDNDNDNDTASQRSISLSSPPDSRRHSHLDPYDGVLLDDDPHTKITTSSSLTDDLDEPILSPSLLSDKHASFDPRHLSFASFTSSSDAHSYPYSKRSSSDLNDVVEVEKVAETPATSVAPSVYEHEEPKDVVTPTTAVLPPITSFSSRAVSPPPPAAISPPSPPPLPTYPPSVPNRDLSMHYSDSRMSVSSFSSGSSRKARPESLLVTPPKGPLVLGIALVDFNHLVGPRIEYSRGDIFEDEEIAKILPFLALPDGAHLSSEDHSYFHLVPSGPNPTTIFGISCNQQIPTRNLLVKTPDMTRSTVQKAVVVLASKPVFGPIRDKLRVITTALFQQRDFTDLSVLEEFGSSLEVGLRGKLTESGLYMGTSLRELVHTFRQRTLVLMKALMLQKRIMFYGHPVERLCTYQYSLVSLMPGLLQNLDDSGSPPLATRAPTLSRPTSLKTSDHKSMMAFMGLPLDVFGKDAFFQPYLPLQQLDMIKDTPSWLCGCTNSIVTHQKEIDLLVNVETGTIEFRDPRVERSAGLTAADRKWMDDIVKDVNEGWDEKDPTRSPSMQFKGSDDYLRAKFEEYISAALSVVKYGDFVAKGDGSGVIITGGTGGDSSAVEDFNPVWIAEFKKTNAYEVWDRVTDPLVFDIIEPRHPCNEKPSVVSDIGLRLQEGIQELKLEQQLAPAREAVSRTIAAGSTNFFKAVEGVRGRWAQRQSSSSMTAPTLGTVSEDGAGSKTSRASTPPVEVSKADLEGHTAVPATSTESVASPIKPALSSWGSGIGSFLSSKAPRFSLAARAPSDADSSKSPPSSPNPNTGTTPIITTTAPSATISMKPGQQSPQEMGVAL
ncbi:transport protein Avl9-domain-containing protein [Cyathus striatus]|nr:transport protein Avl9-domain-containing protein [Cyathus striatus]